MNKIINKLFLATALVALVLSSCTNEADFIDNKTSKTNKNIINNERLFPEYEEIDISHQEAFDLLLQFNESMNDIIPMEDMNINEALLAMEMYFNYAIVDKNTEYDIQASYPQQEFEFTLNIIDDVISGDELKTNYTDFLIGIKSVMANKFLRFSDLFVSSKTDSLLTFTLIIPPYLDGIENINEDIMNLPSCPIVRNINEIPDVPEEVEIDWNIYFEDFVPIPGSGFSGFNYFFNNYQEILHSYCLKQAEGFVYGINSSHLIVDLQNWEQYYFRSNDTYNHDNFPPNHKFNYTEIMNVLLPSTLIASDEIRQSLDNNKYLLDVVPVLDFPPLPDMLYTIKFGGLRFSSYREGYLVHWLELEFSYEIENIIFVD
ncbi:MAG: hypothetical protein WC984_07080 [Bacteroidales bacterium]